jgi:hypothetical protein
MTDDLDDRVRRLEESDPGPEYLDIIILEDQTIRGEDDQPIRIPAKPVPLARCELVEDLGTHRLWRPTPVPEADHGVIKSAPVTD